MNTPLRTAIGSALDVELDLPGGAFDLAALPVVAT